MLGLGLALVMNDAEDADGEAMWLGWPDTVNGDDDGGGGDGGEEVVMDGDGRSHVDLGESKGGEPQEQHLESTFFAGTLKLWLEGNWKPPGFLMALNLCLKSWNPKPKTPA